MYKYWVNSGPWIYYDQNSSLNKFIALKVIVECFRKIFSSKSVSSTEKMRILRAPAWIDPQIDQFVISQCVTKVNFPSMYKIWANWGPWRLQCQFSSTNTSISIKSDLDVFGKIFNSKCICSVELLGINLGSLPLCN